MANRTSKIVTFSGIDGAGKTTQIESAAAELVERGYRVARVTFWDDVAVLPKFRAGVSFRLLCHDDDLSTTLRHDKNVRTWYLTFVRAIFYLLDTWKLRTVVARVRTESPDFVIFDRYVYDQVVQIRSRRLLARLYIRLLITLAPRPHFGFILDASPDDAFKRKPEYPLSFMYGYRRAFLGLRDFAPGLIVIGPGQIEEILQRVLQHLLREPTSPENRPVAPAALEDLRPQ